VYCDRRLPEAARTHEVALGECLGGALYVNDFLGLCKKVGGWRRVVSVVVVQMLALGVGICWCGIAVPAPHPLTLRTPPNPLIP
jgi:hypothetical protein